VNSVQLENEKLKGAIREYVPQPNANQLISDCERAASLTNPLADGKQKLTFSTIPIHSYFLIPLLNADSGVRKLDDPDYGLVKTLQNAMQSFVISDPSIQGCPIVYASSGFLQLTGEWLIDGLACFRCGFSRLDNVYEHM
jgi:hypothetical protein